MSGGGEVPVYEFEGLLLPTAAISPQTMEVLRDGGPAVPHMPVLVATYPRSGTARLIEIAWLVLNGCDTETAQAQCLSDRHCTLDFDNPAFTKANSLQPLVAKTHLPAKYLLNVLDRCGKIIVGVRNPKDCLLSYYHFHLMNSKLGPYTGTWEDFFSMFMNKKLSYGDFFDWQLNWWSHRDRPNIMFVNYEHLSANCFGIIRNIAGFLLDKEMSFKSIETICKWTHFNNMKSNPSTNFSDRPNFNAAISPYMRVGKAGQWKDVLSKEQSKVIDDMCQDKCDPVGLHFRWE